MTLTIRLNDNPSRWRQGQRGRPAGRAGQSPGVAVALNGAVLPRGPLAETRLNDGDELHLFTAIAGG